MDGQHSLYSAMCDMQRKVQQNRALTSGGVGLEERRKDQGLHGHELDENVEGWAGGVLQRVTNSVTNDSGLVRVGALASQGAGVLGGLSL